MKKLIVLLVVLISYSGFADDLCEQAWVAKSSGKIQCDATSGVSLENMRKELDILNIEVFHSKEDSFLKVIALCDYPSSSANTYLICTSDLEKAEESGFAQLNKQEFSR